ncbi:MAG TPA: hypothetical protein VF543_08360 [Pyrinomonadaceae bacterium]|jgi:hypothetical protein
MSEPKCSCEAFHHLEGASVPAYIKAFLEPEDKSAAPDKDLFRCRVCGSLWEKHAPYEKRARHALVRLRGGPD